MGSVTKRLQITGVTNNLSLALLILLSLQTGAHAQFAKPLLSGSNVGTSRLSSQAITREQEGSTAFPSVINSEHTTVYIHTALRREADLAAKRYMVLTIRPTTLTSEQICDINTILGINMLSGQLTIEADASKHQLELIQSVLAPSANDSTLGLSIINSNGHKEINRDPNAEQSAALRRSGDDALYVYKGPIPAAKTLARMIVVVGLIAATIYVAFAAFSITSGQTHGGSRVIAAASGLILLLMGYTIYKILMMNAVIERGVIDTTVITKQLPLSGLVDERHRPVADTPKVPANVGSYAPRSGLQVQPLSGR